jgi:hypothetical protein
MRARIDLLLAIAALEGLMFSRYKYADAAVSDPEFYAAKDEIASLRSQLASMQEGN